MQYSPNKCSDTPEMKHILIAGIRETIFLKANSISNKCNQLNSMGSPSAVDLLEDAENRVDLSHIFDPQICIVDQ